MLTELKENGDTGAAGILFGLRWTLVGSAIFVCFITGFSHVYPAKLNSQELVRASGIKTELREALLRSDKICYARPTQLGVLYSKLFNRDLGRDYILTEVQSTNDCPADSYIIK